MSNPATVPATSDTQTPCPRCRKPLIDPQGLGWCRACGYCRSLEDAPKGTVAETKPAPPNTFTATGAAVGGVPKWFWVSLIGISLIAGATYASGRYLTLAPLDRAVFTTLQIGFGILVMFIGQFIGLLRIAPEDSTLSFKDAIFPFRLYGLILKHLPATSASVYAGSWGLAAVIAAAVFIGGLGHWLTYLPGNQKTGPNQIQKMKTR